AFTALTEGMEPQRVIGLLNECMGRLGAAVEEHGGVVDKYVGDGIMAVFGAPVEQPDHAVRAVRAALRMEREMEALNEARTVRGEPPVQLNIGIHTGRVVAGNMGSPSRLNYTVLGDTVNLAARICDAARDGQVLISPATDAQVRGEIPTRAAGARRFKGVSAEVVLYRVDRAGVEPGAGRDGEPGARRDDAPGAGPDDARAADDDTGGGAEGETGRRPGRGPATRAGLLAGLLAAGLALAVPVRAAAQGALPTLRDLGLAYMSPTGYFQVQASGRLDLEGYVPQESPAWIIPTTHPFVAGRARLFVDMFAGDHLYGLVQFQADRGEAPRAGALQARVEQAFVRYMPGRHVQLQAGKFASPFGAYPQRHHSENDPLIRPPIMYDYRTVLCAILAPGSTAGFLSWKDDPLNRFRACGAPAIWGAPYPWGAMLLGGAGRATFRLAALNSAPSSEPDQWGWATERFRHPSLVANVGYQVSPELHLGLSYNRGPYMRPDYQGSLDPGKQYTDYNQRIWGAEGEFKRGHAILRSEAFLDYWQVPNVQKQAVDLSYYVEGRYTFIPGLYAAARFGEMRFNDLVGGGYGGANPANHWDYDQRRIQIGGGYRILRNLEARAEYMLNHTAGPVDPADNLLSIQVWLAF
ncbi:MAG TPA: adenylate/guanylate cyclase domain-containing protein, partial [Longimicrobiales bacterium]|nr:adenylate/guanylate cyclase domain-containing protein [Longimicrobiales bacterium]